MKSHGHTRICALLLTFALAFTLLNGCSPAAKDTQASSAPADTAVASASAQATAAESAQAATESAAEASASTSAEVTAVQTDTASTEPPVTVSLMMKGVAEEVNGVQTDETAMEIKKKLNITMDVNFTAASEAGVTDEFAAMRASGNLPDLIWVQDGNVQNEMVQVGTFLDMWPLMQQYAPDIIAGYPKLLDYVKTKANYGRPGEILLLPTNYAKATYNPEGANVGPYMRWDYYKELGAKPWDSWNAYLDDVKAALAAHPTNDAGVKSVGLSLSTDWKWMAAGLIGMYSRGSDVFGSWFIEHCRVDDKIYEGLDDDACSFWYGMKVINYAYRIGVLDPDSFTQTQADVSSKIETGQTIAMIEGFLSDKANAAFNLKYGDSNTMGYLSLNYPAAIKGTYNSTYYVQPNGYIKKWGINAKSKHPDRAMELLNYFASTDGTYTAYNGIKGKDWDVVNGVYTRLAATEARRIDPKNVELYGINKYYRLPIYQSNAIHDITGYPVSLPQPTAKDNISYYTDAGIAPPSGVNVDILNFYGAKNSHELMIMQYKPIVSKSPDFISILNTGEIPDDMSAIDAQCINYLNTEYVNLYTAPDDATYNAEVAKVRADLKALNIQKELDFWHDRANTALDAIHAAQ